MGKIFFVTGKSCTGKDTIFNRLVKNKQLGLKTIIGYTTRPMRDNETPGEAYNFVDDGTLEKLTKEGKVIEQRSYNTVYGVWHYFTVDDGKTDLKNNNYVYIGTLESYVKTAAYYGKEKVIPIYIEVEAGERLLRAINREKQQDIPKYKEMCRRFLTDEEDFKEENIIKAGIEKRYYNEDFEECLSRIVKDIKEQMKS